MAKNVWKRPEMAGMDENCCKWLEMAVNGW